MAFNRETYEKIVSGLQSSYNIDNEGLKAEKKTEKAMSGKPVMINKVQKTLEDVEPLPFLTDTKGLADWELRQQ